MAGSPTCPVNYKQEYLAIKYDYDVRCSTITDVMLQGYITNLDAKIRAYEISTVAASSANLKKEVEDAFNPIAQYYANLQSIKERLNFFLECSSTKIQESQSGNVNEERYYNRANPQDSVMPRELVFGFFSQLRPSSIPFVMAAGVFMSCLTLLIIFQMFGFTGEIHIPPAITNTLTAISTASSIPLYQNPMALSGISIVLGVGVIILGVMYYRSKTKNSI
jgi:hypothetical protein